MVQAPSTVLAYWWIGCGRAASRKKRPLSKSECANSERATNCVNSLDTIVHAGRHSASAIEEIMNFRQIDQSPRTFVLVFQTGAERAKAFKIRRRTGVIGREFQGCRRSEICGSRLV